MSIPNNVQIVTEPADKANVLAELFASSSWLSHSDQPLPQLSLITLGRSLSRIFSKCHSSVFPAW